MMDQAVATMANRDEIIYGIDKRAFMFCIVNKICSQNDMVNYHPVASAAKLLAALLAGIVVTLLGSTFQLAPCFGSVKCISLRYRQKTIRRSVSYEFIVALARAVFPSFGISFIRNNKELFSTLSALNGHLIAIVGRFTFLAPMVAKFRAVFTFAFSWGEYLPALSA